MSNNKPDCCCGENMDQDFSQLDEIMKEYNYEKGNLIAILQKTQDTYGYLSLEAIYHIAQMTGIKPAQIYGVATFYSQFRMEPIGENLIMLCKGTACHVNGADIIEEAIQEELGIEDGQTTEDGIFTLNNVACLGCCSLAPVMMIKSSNGDETFGNLTKDSTKAILKEIREKGVQA